MATSIFDENQNQFSTEFEPYDDSRKAFITKETSPNVSASQGIDTTEINAFRQGISITTQAYRFGGLQPKIWAGNIQGFTRIVTYGQTLSWTETKNKKSYEDQVEFNPVSYIQDSNYPFPIVFNEGPQGAKEAKIRAFVFPNWSDNNVESEGLPIHELAARGNVEDGNQDITEIRGKNSRIDPLYNYKESNNITPFLDEGHRYFGDPSTGISVDGYLDYGDNTIQPYSDDGNTRLVNQLSTNDENLITILKVTSSLNLDGDIIGSYDMKSAAAGQITYGPNQGKYGIDSIVFAGFYRGS